MANKLETDGGVNLLAIAIEGDRAVRRMGNMPVSECRNTTHFRNECPVCLSKIKRLKEDGNDNGNGGRKCH